MGKKNQKKIPKMCLNMIVKNEAHIIIETLNNIYKRIDYWVICDTGSTDGTQELIKNFFKEKKINGELFEHKWENFGHNRSLAFKEAYKKSEYIWVIDADDLIVGDLVLPNNMDKDMYLLKYGGLNLCYPRSQIFNNKLKWVYRGVLHEFAKCTNNKIITSETIEGKYFIDSRRLGDRNKDPQKYLKDALTLIKAIENKIDPDLETRYVFYVGQSYRDCNDYDNSIKYYKKRTEMGGWTEEIYVSYMEIGNALVNKKADKKEIIDAFTSGYKTLPLRAECLYFLSTYYIQLKDYINAYKTCKIASKIKNPTNLLLFIKTDIHLYKSKELLYIIYCILQELKININTLNLNDETIQKEKEILYSFLTTNDNVPENIKKKIMTIKQNSDNNKNILQQSYVFDDYVFFDNVDCYSGDIGCFTDKSINELYDISTIYDNCIAFNTYGYIKHTINFPLVPLLNKNYINDGIYIKKELVAELETKYKNITQITDKISITTTENLNKTISDNLPTNSQNTDNEKVENEKVENEKEENEKEENEKVENEKEENEKEENEKVENEKKEKDSYNKKLIEKITEHINKKKDNKKITLTITTCKRIELFKRTINSFINCCKDIILIDEYLCVDDNSTEQDREEMKRLYPFFRWIMKTPEQKGHLESMNIIIDEVKTEYILHLEDDWLFEVESEYITPSIEILNQKNIKSINEIPENREIQNKKIGQVVFNKNYTELPENEVQGGFLCETEETNTKYLIHEHYDTNTENELYIKEVKKYERSAMYWPHFSLHPSIIKTDIFKEVGKFISEGFFERNYANRYYKKGFITCFLNRVSCRHIGKLLSQRNITTIKNAYELNEVEQFNSSKNKKMDNNLNNKEEDNYIFYENKDSYDNDILYIPNRTINELKNIANCLPSCVGFNTLGYLKYKITEPSNFIFLPNLKNKIDGLYVKKNNSFK
jgi:hypothetical protein